MIEHSYDALFGITQPIYTNAVEERRAEVLDTHKPRWRRWHKVCKCCGQSWECTQIIWARSRDPR